MSANSSILSIAAPAPDDERIHRFRLGAAYLAAEVLAFALLAYGLDYYWLSQAQRALSPKHAYLKPSGAIGLRLGMVGFFIFLIVYLYPIRKRWPWLRRKGNTKHWLDFHVLLGLTAPVIITFHSPFKFNGIAGVAYWIMVIVALSGVVGRYIYSQIPRTLNSAELSLKEAQEQSNALAGHLNSLQIVEMDGDDLEVTESRQVRQQAGRTKNLPLLVINGFSMMVLIFHPYYQNSFEFGQLPSERMEGRDLLRVHFQHVKGTRSPSALQLGARNYPLDWEGTAWIDPDTWVIQRIEAGLIAPMGDVGLQVLHRNVRHGPVRFSTSPETYWLPQVAEIEAQTAHQHWRNLHRFTDYRRFSTTVKVKTEPQP